MSYFIVVGKTGDARSQREVIAGPFETLLPVIEVLDRWLDHKMRTAGARYHWWIDQDGPDQQLVVEAKAPDYVL